MTTALGKGLSELFKNTDENIEMNNNPQIHYIKIDDLYPNKYQPRKNFSQESLNSLAISIKESGILQPILVTGATGQYNIVAGERRWRGAKQAGLLEVPVIICEFSDEKSLEVAILENIQREDLNPIEEAEGYAKLTTQYGYTQERIAKFSGKSRSHIANMLRLLSLPQNVKGYVLEGKLNFGQARALIGHPQAEEMAMQIINNGLNVRQAESLVRRGMSNNDFFKKRAENLNPEILELQSNLSSKLGANVSINIDGMSGRGSIQIFFNSLMNLDDIINKLN